MPSTGLFKQHFAHGYRTRISAQDPRYSVTASRCHSISSIRSEIKLSVEMLSTVMESKYFRSTTKPSMRALKPSIVPAISPPEIPQHFLIALKPWLRHHKTPTACFRYPENRSSVDAESTSRACTQSFSLRVDRLKHIKRIIR